MYMSPDGPVPPIRLEFWRGGTPFDAGVALGEEAAPELLAYAPMAILPRIADNRATVREIYLHILSETASGGIVTPAAEWILDNHHLVDETFRHLRRDLTRRVLADLPVVRLAGGETVPRSLAIAWRHVSITNSEISAEALRDFVAGFQTRQVLRINELWAIPALLRFVLLENLRRMAVRVETSRLQRARANALADSLRGGTAAGLAGHAEDLGHESFAAQLLYRLRDSDDPAALDWLEAALAGTGRGADQVIALEQAVQSSGNVTVGNIIRSLRAIDEIDWLDWFEAVSRVDAVLRQSQSYRLLDRRTRNEYRNQIERIARRSPKDEIEVAERALAEAPDDPGMVLVGPDLPALERDCGYRPKLGERGLRAWRRLGWAAVALPVLALTAVLAAALGGIASGPLWLGLALLAVLPASEAAAALVGSVAGRVIPPAQLPGYDFSGGIPPQARTLVVVPCMLTSRDEVDDLLANLERHYLANPRGAVDFALLSDWGDSPTETRRTDAELLAQAREGIDDLARRYLHDGGRRFYLLHRRRIFNPGEGVWMGWERKRGKLAELNDLLRGEEDTSFIDTGERPPEPVRYVLTLDADTRLTRGSVAALVGKAAHPANRPVLAADGRRVVAGYGILQPRVTPSLTTGVEASIFQRVFSTHRGFDPYVFTVSDLYQDLLSEGSFTGKGLYDIDAFRAATEGAIGENAVLSHDLLEGSLTRAALVTDVELVEDFPTRYHVDAARQHRWIRGDWQLLPYAFGRRAPVGALGRLKMIDNLRRSLLAPGWLVASAAGWLVLDWRAALAWQAGLVALLMAGPLLAFVAAMKRGDPSVGMPGHLRALAAEAAGLLAQTALRLAFVADQAARSVDAILRTLYRMLVSRRHLLEWRTAGAVASAGGNELKSYARRMAASPVIGAAALGAVAALNPGTLGVALPVAALWIAAPVVAWAISRTDETADRLDIRPPDAAVLRRSARLTWAFFEDFVTPASNHLPPDNFQDNPAPKIAERTSPTNIGLYLLGVVSAREFGWISLRDAVGRLEATLTTVERMAKHRGHLYNWYDTRDLTLLHPHYVSSVDSGNLAGHLVAVAMALKDWASGPEVHMPPDPRGLGDVLAVLQLKMAAIPDDRRMLRPLRRRVEERIEGFRQSYAAYLKETQLAPVRGITLSVIAGDIEKLARALHSEVESDDSGQLVRWSAALVAACQAIVDDSSGDRGPGFRGQIERLAERARALAFGMDFAFLMDPAKRLLSIGWNAEAGRLDQSFYDLLASEARLASFFAIAKGDLPNEHWFRLGRPVTTVRARGVLMSWSGSMFEYLMPPLVMKEPVGGILNQSNLGAIRAQMDAAKAGRAWGVSESAMNARDSQMNYQYHAFGLAALALRRWGGSDHVIAPYATFLASQFLPQEAVKNLGRLDRMGASGGHGYFDAIDLTPERLPEGANHAVVRTVMAHHQGMVIVAVANAVMEGLHRERFHADPVIRAAELLLQERSPREVVPVTRPDTARSGLPERDRSPATQTFVQDTVASDRAVVLLSNGRYSKMLTSRGSGWSRIGDTAVLRWRGDPTLETDGSFVFLRDLDSGRWWSATAAPRSDPDQSTSAVFSDHKAEFLKTVGTIETHLEALVAWEADAEGLRLTIRNKGAETRRLEVTSYAEIVLDAEAADRAHPAFSKMFVETAISADGTTITARRHDRESATSGLHLAHLIAGEASRGMEAETDRRAFIGRGRTLATAAAFDGSARLSGSQGFTMDPVAALRRRIRVAPGKEVVLTFWTVTAASGEALAAAVQHYRNAAVWDHESRLAWTQSQIYLRLNGSSLDEVATFREVARHLLFPDLRLAAPERGARGRVARQWALWPLGISGDVPILMLRVDNDADLPMVRTSLRMIDHFRAKGLKADLVVMNEQTGSYVADLQTALTVLADHAARIAPAGARRSVFVLRRDQVAPETVANLFVAARIVLHARNGTWADQLSRLMPALPPAPDRSSRPLRLLPPPDSAARPTGLAFPEEEFEFWNGIGGFADGGRTHVTRLRHGEATPHPWINIIARGGFGFHVSAEGCGFTWAANSRDYQVTPWSNDPVENRPGEGLVVRDRASGRLATPFAALSHDPVTLYEARHSPGRSVFRSWSDWLDIEAEQSLSPEGPAKLTRLRLRNRGTERLELECLAWAELVQGNNRPAAAPLARVAIDAGRNALVAENGWNGDFAGRQTVLAADRPFAACRSDRAGLFDPLTGALRPAPLREWPGGERATDTRGDPCLAAAVTLTLEPGGSVELGFALADAPKEQMADLLPRLFRRPAAVAAADEGPAAAPAADEWEKLLGTLQVRTPDRKFDILINSWLPYQCLACRIRARSAFYQASGAYGFRDQLQDTSAMILQDPSLARAQILGAAGRQFLEGDVQHWWLPTSGMGVRTLISDDVVWLAHSAARYVALTGDAGVLDEPVPYLTGAPLREGQHDAFTLPETADLVEPLYDHCARALDLALARTSPRGLPLILGGDWNDGMNRVGIEGRGESIWLGWFLCDTIASFAPVAEARGDTDRAARWRAHRDRVARAIDQHGWDGEWYRRGTFDDGSLLGSSASAACRIDSIAQSWAAISGAGSADRARQALDAALSHLNDREAGVMRLFTPPFTGEGPDPGYIAAYPPGVRENGGQYTHAATWMIYALARAGRGDDAFELFDRINPISHALTREAAELYRVEPYVVAADVYGEGDKTGRGGWTWYTGAAGWLYRAGVEGILGIVPDGPDGLRISPALPSGWDGYTATLRRAGRIRTIRAFRRADGSTGVEIDGQDQTAGR